MVWINALIASGGGQIIENAELGADATPTVASPAGDKAAEIVGTLARSSAAPADMSTAGEEEARSLFQGDNGSFMVNWPYVYQRREGRGDSKAPSISQWSTTSPGPAIRRRTAGTPSTPPLGGINLAIGAFTKYPDEALAAAKCITSLESNIQYMIKSGNPAARAAAYDDPAVREAFPMADLIRESINDAGPRPVTPYYGDVSVSVQRTWHPPESVQHAEHARGDRRLHVRRAQRGRPAVTARGRGQQRRQRRRGRSAMTTVEPRTEPPPEAPAREGQGHIAPSGPVTSAGSACPSPRRRSS